MYLMNTFGLYVFLQSGPLLFCAYFYPISIILCDRLILCLTFISLRVTLCKSTLLPCPSKLLLLDASRYCIDSILGIYYMHTPIYFPRDGHSLLSRPQITSSCPGPFLSLCENSFVTGISAPKGCLYLFGRGMPDYHPEALHPFHPYPPTVSTSQLVYPTG